MNGGPMIDKTTKLLLLAIAIGLWVNVLASWVRPTPVRAAQVNYLHSIDANVARIAKGVCASVKC
jgi:hypothetical protein